MHESLFSYNLTRPYPFRWFTWVVAVGGICAIVFFSFLNLAANGYTLEVVYTTDPNGTVTQSQWFEKAPWKLMTKMTASCQAQDIALNTELFTTQLGLTYVLANVWTNDSAGNAIMYPSLTYLNNTLEDCSIRNIMLDAENSNKLGNFPYWAWQTSRISAVATCSVNNGNLQSAMNLTVQYQPILLTDSSTSDVMNGVAAQAEGFLHLDMKNKASIWWGQQLLWCWYYNVGWALSEIYNDQAQTPAPNNTLSRMQLYLSPTGSKNISNYDFFDTTFWYYFGDGSLVGSSEQMSESPGRFDVGFQIDRFAKVFYSTILADLGQADGPNVVADPNLVQLYLTGTYPDTGIPAYSPTNEAYAALKNSTGPLSIASSTFYAQYVCQVPRRRDIGSLLIAVLVGDIVFLQALFKVLTWTTTLSLTRTDPTTNFCEGCAAARKGLAAVGGHQPYHSDGVPLLPASPDVRTSTPSPGLWKSPREFSRQISLEESQVQRFPRKPVGSGQYESVPRQ